MQGIDRADTALKTETRVSATFRTKRTVALRSPLPFGPRDRASRGTLALRLRREPVLAGIGASLARPEESLHADTVHSHRSRGVNAASIAAALGERAEALCRQYLPHSPRLGRQTKLDAVDAVICSITAGPNSCRRVSVRL